MPVIEAQREIAASREALWRVALGYESWPEWSPLFQLVRPEDPARGLNGEWTLNGLLGRIPYTGVFQQVGHRPLEAWSFASLRVSPPYDFIRHTVLLSADPVPRLTWRVTYTMSGGPGGWLIDRLLIRPRVAGLIARHQQALDDLVA